MSSLRRSHVAASVSVDHCDPRPVQAPPNASRPSGSASASAAASFCSAVSDRSLSNLPAARRSGMGAQVGEAVWGDRRHRAIGFHGRPFGRTGSGPCPLPTVACWSPHGDLLAETHLLRCVPVASSAFYSRPRGGFPR
jgi:hypothetical protein